MAGNCGSCTHWTPPSERDDYKSTVNLHGPIEPVEEREARWRESQEADQTYGICDRIPMGPIEEKPIPLALTMDASEYMAILFTQAEFGCVLFEAKEG